MPIVILMAGYTIGIPREMLVLRVGVCLLVRTGRIWLMQLVVGQMQVQLLNRVHRIPRLGMVRILTAFSALPGGYRWGDGSFYVVGDWGGWWSATEGDADDACSVNVVSGLTSVFERWNYKSYGFSVRCLRD